MKRLIRRILRDESGQTLILAIFAFVTLTAVAAIALDLGDAYGDKSRAQRAADSAAIAAADVLANDGTVSEAITAAHSWAEENGYGESDSAIDVTVNIPPAAGPHAGDSEFVEVIIDHAAETHFAKILDFNLWNINARSVASGADTEPFTGLMPWAVKESAINYDGTPTAMKYDSNNGSNGNFGSLRLFGSGSSNYENNIKYGAQGPLCVQSMPDCDDPTEDTEPGNMIGGTRDGVNYRLSNTSTACDSYSEVFTSGGDLKAPCDPFNGAPDSLRVLLVPVVETFCNGHCTVTLKYFALLFLNDLGTCKGNSCTVTGTFVKKVFDPAAELGFTPGDPGGSIYLAE